MLCEEISVYLGLISYMKAIQGEGESNGMGEVTRIGLRRRD